MQNKLYFLDEQEKNRILNLHESRTQGQYLLNEAIDRKSLTKKMSDICTQGTYGTGSFTEQQVDSYAKNFKTNFPAGATYKSNESLRTIAQNIRNMKTISNYCRVAKKYKQIGGKTFNGTLSEWISKNVYQDIAWELYIKQPFEELIKNAEVAKQKGDEADFAFYQSGTTTGQTQQQVAQQPATNYQQVAGGYVLNPFTTQAVNTLRNAIGITGQGGLNQTDINQLYAKIATLPNKTV